MCSLDFKESDHSDPQERVRRWDPIGMVGRKWLLSWAQYALHHRREMELCEDIHVFQAQYYFQLQEEKWLTDWLAGYLTD
jgi:hypothetical protein